MQYSTQSSELDGFNTPNSTADFVDAPASVALPKPDRVKGETVPSSQLPACIRLNLEGLQCFEVVEEQFKQWGVIFQNAIALQPSNPAFPACTGTTVLMGAPQNGLIEATFLQPVRFVSAAVTSSRETVLSAYDGEGNLLSESKLVGENLAGSDSPNPPNYQLSLRSANIHRVKFYASNGQLTVDDFSFSA